jgi:hypothetical protein
MGRLGLSVPCAALAIENFEQLRRGSVLERGRREEEEEGNAVAGLVGFLCLLGLFRVHTGCAAMGYSWKGPNKALAFKETRCRGFRTHAPRNRARREGGQVDDGVRQLCPRPLERSDSAEVRDPNLDGLISEFDYI